MDLKNRAALVIAVISAGLALCVWGADFAPPASGPVAFRRDRIPLAVGTMTGLSRSLETIARSLPGETAAERQAIARALALAMALDPSNEEPGKLLGVYQNDERPQAPDATKLAGGQARIWQLVAWLETPEAGTHGQTLAFCLKDVMAVADPKHPRSAELRAAGDKGTWTGWVPGIEAYQSREVAKTPETGSGPRPRVIVKPPPSAPAVTLPNASVDTVFNQPLGTGDSAKWTLALASLQMSATRTSGDGDSRFSIVLGNGGWGASVIQSVRTIQTLLEKQHGVLPSGMRVRIRGPEFERALASGKVPSVTAAAAVLANSAVTGREPEAIIIGKIDASGAFTLPSRFWDQLQALGQGNGRRVVLPKAAADWLPSLVALENPEFFLDHEVLLADDFGQLLALSAKSPESAVADAAAKFREIRERAQGQDIRSYLANRFVRERLDELVKSAPFHASAAMLLLQGTLDRPRHVSRAVLASELRLAIDPMAWIARLESLEPNDPQAVKFGGIHDACKDRIDQIERYADRTDLDLVERAKAVDSSLRRLDRAARGRGEYYLVEEEMRSARTEFARLYREVAEELAKVCYDSAR